MVPKFATRGHSWRVKRTVSQLPVGQFVDGQKRKDEEEVGDGEGGNESLRRLSESRILDLVIKTSLIYTE